MKKFTRRLIIAGISFYIALLTIPAIDLGIDPKNPLIIIASLFVIATIIRPIFHSIMLPVNFLTLALMSLILNFALLFLLQKLLPGFSISNYDFPGTFINGVIIPAVSFNQLATTGIVAFVITLSQRLLPLLI